MPFIARLETLSDLVDSEGYFVLLFLGVPAVAARRPGTPQIRSTIAAVATWAAGLKTAEADEVFYGRRSR
jgi:hypothetical protein